MVKIDARNVYGYDVDESDGDPRLYDLPSGTHLIVGKEIGKLEVILGTADNHHDEDHDNFFQTLDAAISIDMGVVAAVDSKFNGAYAKEAEKSLAARLSNYEGIVRPQFRTLYLKTFDEPEFVLLLAQCSDPKDFDSFLEKCLKMEQMGAERSLKSSKPNYSLRVPYLVADISGYLERQINISGIPEVIRGFTPYRYAGQDFHQIDENYVAAIVQKNGSSFTYDTAMQRKVRKLTKDMNDGLEKSKAIFEWVISNISYDKKEEKSSNTYRGALQTYKDKKGVCGESAALQVTMERLAGNRAYLVEVPKGTKGMTNTGREANADHHACAAHLRPNGEVILIDTTIPDGFGIKYNDFCIVSDDHSLARY